MSDMEKLNEEELDLINGGKGKPSTGKSDKDESIVCQYCGKTVPGSKFKAHVKNQHPGEPVVY
ncbi:MAG: hypothetical protein IKQ97_10650 [Eubacterium sp.]|nr:hypothetical protein [Eubacterium sp.]